MSRYAVVLNAGNGTQYAYGPIVDIEHARLFAQFMTREVDPAEAVKLIDPIDELLAYERRTEAGDKRPMHWPPYPGHVWEDRNGDRWVCTRTSGKYAYLVCLARMGDDNAEEIYRQHGPMTHVGFVAPTKAEEPPF